jgi:hypothetical protein
VEKVAFVAGDPWAFGMVTSTGFGLVPSEIHLAISLNPAAKRQVMQKEIPPASVEERTFITQIMLKS